LGLVGWSGSGEANKQDLVNTKKYDQDLQQLDGNFQSALKFAMHLRAHYSEIENGWRKQRFKLEADLEALIANYDKEMGARQQSIDDCLMTEEANTKEIEHLEKVNEKVMKRYAQFKDETTIKKIRRRRTVRRIPNKRIQFLMKALIFFLHIFHFLEEQDEREEGETGTRWEEEERRQRE